MTSMEPSALAAGVRMRCVPGGKFKTFRISVHFFVPLEAQQAAANALLPALLTRASSAYPDFTRMQQQLATLYGANLRGEVSRLGNCQALSITAEGIADRYALSGERISLEMARLLCEAIFAPALDTDGLFREEDFCQEQRQLLEEIDAEYSDKQQYALQRCRCLVCEGQPEGTLRYGSRQAVQHLTRAVVTDAWRQLLRTARVEILALGDCDPAPVQEAFRTAFAGVARSCVEIHLPQPLPARQIPRRESERQEIVQGKMVLGFRLPDAVPAATVPAAHLMSVVLGGTPSSKFFVHVREEQSLCYYCGCSYDRLGGLLFVQSGVEFANMDKAEAAVMEQLAAMQAGDFTAEEVQAAKLALANAYNTMEDSLEALDSWYMSRSLQPVVESPRAYMARVQCVRAQEITAAAKGVRLDTVFRLEGKEAAE